MSASVLVWGLGDGRTAEAAWYAGAMSVLVVEERWPLSVSERRASETSRREAKIMWMRWVMVALRWGMDVSSMRTDSGAVGRWSVSHYYPSYAWDSGVNAYLEVSDLSHQELHQYTE